MFLEERHNYILDILNRDGKVLVKDLAALFNVTDDSIRKDLAALESDGKLKRTYGGAVSIKEKLQMTQANQRRLENVLAKRKIANAALKLMLPNQLIFLDISTISIAIAQILEKTSAHLSILTNMVDVLVMLARNPNINLTFAGGNINLSRDGFVDPLASLFLSNFRPDISFVGAFGVDILKNSLTSRDTNGGVHGKKGIHPALLHSPQLYTWLYKSQDFFSRRSIRRSKRSTVSAKRCRLAFILVSTKKATAAMGASEIILRSKSSYMKSPP